MTENTDIFKLRIKDILSDKNMTSKELADRMGKAPQYISNIINGGKGVSIPTLIEIAKYLDVEFRDLFASTRQTDAEVIGAVRIGNITHVINSKEDIKKLAENNCELRMYISGSDTDLKIKCRKF